MSPPRTAVISGCVTPEQRQAIEALGQGQGISAGLREVVAAGLAALRCDAALLQPLDQLQATVERLSAITGRTTAAGAWWAPSPSAMPPAEVLDPDGDVIATPHGVLLVTLDGVLSIDLAERVIWLQLDHSSVSAAVDVSDLAGPAAMIAPALVGLAAAGPGRRDIGMGLAVERLPHGPCRISLQGVGVEIGTAAAWTWCAEVVALVARAMADSAARRNELEQRLAEVAA